MWGGKIIQRAESAVASVNTEINVLSGAIIVAAALLFTGLLILAAAVSRG